MVGIISVCCVLVASSRSSAVAADWLHSTLTVAENRTYNQPKDGLDMNSVSGNKPTCNNYSVVVRPKIITLGKTTQQELRQTICGYGVAGGVYGNNWLLRNNTGIAGQLKPAMSTYGPAIGIPGSNNILELASAGSNAYKVYIVQNAYPQLVTVKDSGTKAISYKLPNSNVNSYLKMPNGADLFIDYNTIAFSDNGLWMVADGLNNGFVRINTQTGDVLPFAYNFSTPNRSVYSMNAVSNDGNYALISATYPFQRANLYDLTTCQPKSGQAYLNCANRDIQTFMSSQRAKYYGFTTVRFVTSEAIEAYAVYELGSNGVMKVGKIVITAVNGELTKVNYMALGDSFSAGQGVYNYRPETDTTDNKCHQSYDSYGYILSHLLPNTDSFRSITCSGAKVKDIILQTDNEDSYNSKDRQAQGKVDTQKYDTEIYSLFLPGYRLQKNFVEKNKPRIITMSIGGNDIGFSEILKKCVSPLERETCYKTYDQRKDIVDIVNNVYPKLLDTYRQLKQQAADDAKIYIVGYPQLAMENGNCANNVKLNNEEIIFSNKLITYLNGTIKMAADHAGVYYVDIEHALDGHRFCETTSNNVAANGINANIRALKSAPKTVLKEPVAPESYHPNKLGQQLMAQAIAQKTNNLTAPMPAAVDGEPQFVADDQNILLQGVPKDTFTNVDAPMYADDMVPSVVVSNAQESFTVSSLEYSLKANTSYRLTAYSSPTDMGSVTTDTFGDINARVTIPATLEPGYHTFHLAGKNIQDEDIDIQKIVYVAASENDYDGDGTDNEDELCVGVDASYVDIDKDGVDDACDGFIDEAPPEPESIPEPIPDSQPDPIQPSENPQPQEPILEPQSPPAKDIQITNVIQTYNSDTSPDDTNNTDQTTDSSFQDPTPPRQTELPQNLPIDSENLDVETNNSDNPTKITVAESSAAEPDGQAQGITSVEGAKNYIANSSSNTVTGATSTPSQIINRIILALSSILLLVTLGCLLYFGLIRRRS